MLIGADLCSTPSEIEYADRCRYAGENNRGTQDPGGASDAEEHGRKDLAQTGLVGGLTPACYLRDCNDNVVWFLTCCECELAASEQKYGVIAGPELRFRDTSAVAFESCIARAFHRNETAVTDRNSRMVKLNGEIWKVDFAVRAASDSRHVCLNTASTDNIASASARRHRADRKAHSNHQ